MAAPYLIVGLAGDSNGFWGKFRDVAVDVGHSRIFAYTNAGSVVAAAEPLDNLGYGEGDGHKVGSTLALCRLLIERGHLPDGFDILIVPHCWAGTAFLNYWATTGDRNALDGGAGDTIGFLAHMSNAVALHANNRVWFFDWNHGANDSVSEATYTNNMIATWAEIRSTVPTASDAPLLVTGIPPNRIDPLLGNSTTHGGVIAAQENIASNVPNSIYVDPTGLTAIDDTNGYVHFPAASHRGGTNNAPGNTGEVVTIPLSERKYDGLAALGILGTVTPTEVYMWLPDVVAVVVRDAPPIKGIVTPVYQDESAQAHEAWLDRVDPRDSQTRKAILIGPTKNYLRFQDQLSTTFLGRDAATDPANWTLTGFAGTITNVILLCEPYDHAQTTHSGTVLQTVQEHTLLLHLSTNLPEGSYTISNGTADIVPTGFTFDDTITRAGGINVNQVGYRPSDLFRTAILAKRLPGGPNGGVVNFADYGVSTFNILNENKTVIFTGSVAQRVDPDDTEPGYASIYVADYANPKTVTTITNANPGVATVTGHGLSTGDRVRFRGMPTGFASIENTTAAQTITVDGADPTNKFSFGVNTTSMGAYATGTWSTSDGGYDSLVYPCVLMNRAGTYCYSLDFSALSLASGTYYIQIPGYGISDPFIVSEAVHSIAFGRVHEGLYALRRGIAVESGEFTRGANFRDDGITFFRNYRCRMTAGCIQESTVNSVDPQFITGYATFEPAITSERVTLTASGWGVQDAGDNDTYLNDHMPTYVDMMSMLLEVPAASRVTNFTVPLSSVAIGSRYAGTDHWPPIMHEIAWFMDFWLSLQQEDGSVLSGLSIGHFSSQSPNYGEPSDLYHGNNSQNYDGAQLTGPGVTVHAGILSPDHWCNYWAATGFALFSLLCYDYGNTTLGDTYKQAAIDAWDWGELIRSSHLGDGVDRDAHYDTYLTFKKLPIGTNTILSITAVDVTANTATVEAGHGFTSGMKVGVQPGTGALPGGLSPVTDYWVNVSTNTVSFHSNATDAGTGANKIDLTAGFSAGPIIFRTMTDAEYTTVMNGLQTKADQVRPHAAGALLRCVGWDNGSTYAALFVAGTPTPGAWHVHHYWRAAQAAGNPAGSTSVVNYMFGHYNDSFSHVLDYNATANVAFPAAHNTNANTSWGTGASDAPRQFRSLMVAIDQGTTAVRDKCLTNLQAHAAFVQGCNLTGKCMVSGAGVRHQAILVHDDAFVRGQGHPNGIPGYAWNLWPLAGSVFFNGPEVGPSNWSGINVKTGTAAHAYKIVEPWKFAQSYWECQMDNRGLITQSEYSINTSHQSHLVATLAARLWDQNTEAKFRPVVHFRRKKAA